MQINNKWWLKKVTLAVNSVYFFLNYIVNELLIKDCQNTNI